MRLFDLLRLSAPGLTPEQTKIHLACSSYSGKEKPLDAYIDGTFQEFQSWQSQASYFNRKYVVSLVQLDELHQWLFAGAYTVHGHKPDGIGVRFRLKEIPACGELDGRLVTRFEKIGRNCYRVAENSVDEITVSEIRPTKLGLPDFPGFKGLLVTKHQLDSVVRENHGGWRAALSSVAGVYLIADAESGKFYVGSATGEGGIWQRWCQYSASGHGGNRDLKALLGVNSLQRAATFQFSVLEIADTHASIDEIRARESHWKQVLLTRIHGLNAN
jgi:hypothetical protein